MDFELNEAQRGARATARRFAREKLSSVGVEIDRTHQFPTEAVAELGRLGMLGVFIPEKYGGAGLDNVSATRSSIEELSVECASTGGDRVGPFIARRRGRFLALGTESQRRALSAEDGVRRMARLFRADRAAGRLRRRRPEDTGGTRRRQLHHQRNQEFHYQRPRSRRLRSCLPMTDASKGTHGISAFIVETSSPGFAGHAYRRQDGHSRRP